MPPRAKSILMWIGVIILLYTVVQNPERAANAVRVTWDFIYNAFAGFGSFLGNLAS